MYQISPMNWMLIIFCTLILFMYLYKLIKNVELKIFHNKMMIKIYVK